MLSFLAPAVLATALVLSVRYRKRRRAGTGTGDVLRDVQRCLRRVVRHVTDPECTALTADEKDRLAARFRVCTVRTLPPPTFLDMGCSYLAQKRDMHLLLMAAGGQPKARADVVFEAVHLLCYMAHADVGHTQAFWDIERRVRCELAMHPHLTDTLDEHAVRRRVAARRILRCWRIALSDPKYALCRARLLREFSELLPTLSLVTTTTAA